MRDDNETSRPLSWIKTIALVIAGVASLILSIAWAADVTPSPNIDKADVGNVDVGDVFSANHALGREMQSSDGKALGVVSDFAIDLDNSQIALVAVRPAGKDSGQNDAGPVWLITPSMVAKPSDAKSPLRLSATLPKEAQLDSADWRSVADRSWLEKVFGQKDKTPGNQPPIYGKFAWISTLQGTSVTHPKGETLGKIIDVALTRGPLAVAYVILNPTDPDEQVAGAWGVPLSALIVPPNQKSWQLDLLPGRLANIPKIDPKHLPNKVDKAWQEYVSVAYGNAIDEGAQPEPPTTRSAPE